MSAPGRLNVRRIAGTLVAVLLAPALAGCGEQAARLEVTQSHQPKETGPGDAVAFVVSITNQGPGVARGVRIFDRLPPGFQYRSTTTAGGNGARTQYLEPQPGATQPAWGVWTIPPPSGRESKVVIGFQARAAQAPGTYTNELRVTTTSSSTLDLAAAAKVVVIPRAALVVEVTTATPEARVGSTAGYTITILNTGSAEASGVSVTDSLPSGFQFTATQLIEGNAGRVRFVDPIARSLMPTWAQWTIPAAAREGPGLLRIVFEARVLPGTPAGLYGNTVHVFGDKGLRVLAGNVAPVSVR